MSDLTRAAEALRASVAARPEVQRAEAWCVLARHGGWWLEAGGVAIAKFGDGADAKADAEYVVLTASPDVVIALADLLDAVEVLVDNGVIEDDGNTYHRAEALAAAILRDGAR